MHFKSILLLAATLGLSRAFIVPEGLEDGAAYSIEMDENGKEYHKLLASAKELSERSLEIETRAPLPAGKIGCESTVLNYNDLAAAQFRMYSYCGASAPFTSKKMFFPQGKVFTYTCNYGKANTCADHEARAAFDSLAGNCGNPSAPVAAWYWLPAWAKNYGYDSVGVDVCTNL